MWIFRVPLTASLVACLLGLAPLPKARAAEGDHHAARNMLRTYCHRCHSGGGSEGGDFDLLDVATLTTAEEGTRPLVAPGNPGGSRLIDRIILQEMPPDNHPKPGADEVAALWKWIAAGAPAFPQAEQKAPRALSAVLTAAADYASKQDQRTQPFLRFFTLHTISNHPRTTADDLRLHRAALSKALNSLSRVSQIVVPKAVDESRTLYVIDLRDLGWDRGTQWALLASAYPYGLKYDAHPNAALRDADTRLRQVVKAVIPMLRSDWFVATATRPPLYHDLLQLPSTLAELKQELKIDSQRDFLNPTVDRLARAAFSRSGVSGQNRGIDRHGSGVRVLYESYDELPNRPRGQFFRFPLGPLNLFENHPFADQAFEHDGGELIGALENQLHFYLLVDGTGKRIKEGPIKVVGDALKTSGTNEIVNGVSCMACHKHGIIPFQDELRDRSAVFDQPEAKLRELVPPQAEWDRLQRKDSDAYLDALSKAVLPLWDEPGVAKSNIRDLPEPVGPVARQYRLAYLDVDSLAAELDLPSAASLANIGGANLKRLGLGGLLGPDGAIQKDGVVSRNDWEAVNNGVSLMQSVAFELLATPARQFPAR
jgi:hypothetical protein